MGVNFSLFLYTTIKPYHKGHTKYLLNHPEWFVLLSFFWIVWSWSFDCYEPRVMHRFVGSVRSAFFACLGTIGLFLLIPYITPVLPTRRWIIFTFFTSCCACLTLSRILFYYLFTGRAFKRRVLIVGTGASAKTVVRALKENGWGAYDVVGFVCDSLDEGSEKEIDGYPVIGNLGELRSLIVGRRITTLVVALNGNMEATVIESLINCLEFGVEIVPMNVMYEELTGRVAIYHVDNEWYVALPVNHPLTRTFNKIIKRAFDVFFATFGLLLLLPLFPIIVVAIYLDCPGPIFYTQERVGRGGKVFKVYKFRSMVPDAEQGKPVWACKGDPRVTRVGRLLRRTHIDEFPQIINILKGDMSVVGPRPERPEFVEDLAREIPFYRIRHAVKPGMAGWALVKYGYAASKEDTVAKLQYDLYYIKHWSIWLDVVILVKTVMDTLAFRGRA